MACAGKDGSVEDVFCQTFTAGMPGMGETLIVPLIPGGQDIVVTEDNRRQYVEAYQNFVLESSVHKQVMPCLLPPCPCPDAVLIHMLLSML